MEVCEVMKCHVKYMIVVGKRNKTLEDIHHLNKE